ncbi:MAG: dephospho-CoA kinase, partial [Clostridia bacterium]|nr:dephospho-CoA kinase [Clostridia bacterium]
YRQEDGVLFAEVSAFDNSMKEYFDTVIFVRSEKSTRIERVKNRDGKKEDYILSVMAGQLSDEEMERLSDFVIVNDGDEQALESQIEWILQWLQK